jgi:hypothetical protein
MDELLRIIMNCTDQLFRIIMNRSFCQDTTALNYLESL